MPNTPHSPAAAAFTRLLDILDNLREKCPWDRKQTNASLRPNTIEEVYELCDALIKDDSQEDQKRIGRCSTTHLFLCENSR